MKQIKQKIFRHNYCLGCVIDTNNIRYAIIEKKAQKIKIISCGNFPLPLKKETDLNMNLSILKKSKAIIGISNKLVHLKLTAIDSSINSIELKKYIQLNVASFFKYSYDALYLDYRLILQKLYILSLRNDQKCLQLLAARKHDLNDALLALKFLKIRYSIISVECIAWINLIKKFFKIKKNIYTIIFFEKFNFSILVIEKKYLIYKNQFKFFSENYSEKSNSVIQAIFLIKSLYPSTAFNYYVAMGHESDIIFPDLIKKEMDYFNLSLFLKINLPDKDLLYYCAAIGLVL